MKNFARIQSIEITNFKNVTHGKVDFSNYDKNNNDYESDISAIYGQNGSGKTALIDALSLVRKIILGKTLPRDIKKYIKNDSQSCKICTCFYININNLIYIISYEFVLSITEDGVIVSEENIKAQDNSNNGEFSNFNTVFSYKTVLDTTDDKRTFSIQPSYLSKDLSKNIIDLLVAHSLSQQINPNSKIMESTSFVFSRKFLDIIEKTNTKSNLNYLLKILKDFIEHDLIIIEDKNFGGISENIHAIPIFTKSHIRYGKNDYGTAIGAFPIEIYKKTKVPTLLFPVYEKFIDQVNEVLPTIVPNIQIEMSAIEKIIMQDGSDGTSFEICTLRDNIEHPIALKYESAGIKKILCILSALIAAYNNYDMCFVVDELDSGIFEYLLGQIIKVFKNDAKGQLIFTSHNLHVVELLDNKSLIFTCSDENNCYMHLPNVKSNNNKRLLYMRQLELSGDELLYNKTNQYEMSFAFEMAYDTSKEGDFIE